MVGRDAALPLRVGWVRASGGSREVAEARDISLGGMFLQTNTPLGPGALLTLEIEGSSKVITVDARVLSARTKSIGPDFPAGMSVRFIDLPNDVAATLQSILSSRMRRDQTMLGLGESEEGAANEPIPELPKLPRPPTSGSGEMNAIRFGPVPTPNFALPLPEPAAAAPLPQLSHATPPMAIAPPPHPSAHPPAAPPAASPPPNIAPVVLAPHMMTSRPPPTAKKKSVAPLIVLVVVALFLVGLGTSAFVFRHRIHETFLGPRH